MVDQDGNQLQQPVPAHTEQQKQLQQQMQMQQQALIQQQEQQKQLQQAFLSEVRSFDQENENANKKRPRTSDADFNKDKTNLIVNYLPQSFTDQEFFNLFSTVGKVNKARIIRHRQTGYSYGYGFIDMATADDADKAIKKLNQYQIGHKRLKVAFSLPSGERTRNINLYIKGLPKNWTKKTLENQFRIFGDIRNARILLDPATQQGTGVGFLLFSQKHMAEKACEGMNGKTVPEGTEPLQISFARSQSQPPLEWILQTSLMQSYQTVPTIPMNPMNPIGVSVAPQATSAYKGRRYNPIVRPSNGTMMATPQRQQHPFMLANQPMIMVPAYSQQFAQNATNASTSQQTPQMANIDGTQMTFSNASNISGQPQTIQSHHTQSHPVQTMTQQQIQNPQTMSQPIPLTIQNSMGMNPMQIQQFQASQLAAQPFQQQLSQRNYFSTGVM